MKLPEYDGVEITMIRIDDVATELSVRTWKHERKFILVMKEGDNPEQFEEKVIRKAHIEAAFLRFITGSRPHFPVEQPPIDPEHDRRGISCITPCGNESDCVRILSHDTTHTHPEKYGRY